MSSDLTLRHSHQDSLFNNNTPETYPKKSSYEKNKQSIYKWRENNKEKYNDICNKAQAVYYMKNKERISQRKKEWYKRKKAEKLAAEKCENGKL